MQKTILFDIDGTLFDSIHVIVETFVDTFDEMQLPFPGEEAVKAGIGKHLEVIFGGFVPGDRVEEAVQVYRRHYIAKQDAGIIQPFPDAKSFLKQLQEKEHQMGVVTTKLGAYTEKLLEHFSLDIFFDTVVGAEHVTHCKPDPEPLLLAAKQLHVSPEDGIYIGDSIHDAEAARAAGMGFIGVLTGTGKRKELEKFGEVYGNLGEIIW